MAPRDRHGARGIAGAGRGPRGVLRHAAGSGAGGGADDRSARDRAPHVQQREAAESRHLEPRATRERRARRLRQPARALLADGLARRREPDAASLDRARSDEGGTRGEPVNASAGAAAEIKLPMALPATASRQAREASAFGLGTATLARDREFGQGVSEAARTRDKPAPPGRP